MSIQDRYKLALERVEPGDVSPVMLFPLGTFKSSKYPELPLTRELADEVISNFAGNVLGTEPVVDTSGKHDTSAPAGAWVKRVYVSDTKDGGEALYADVQWTEAGAQKVNDHEYQYNSVELGPVVDNVSGERTENVLRSVTLTNTPVIRILPKLLEAGDTIAEPVDVALSEVTAADDPDDDPMASLLSDLEAVLDKAGTTLKGKPGVRTIRTYLRETLAKASAHKLAEPGSVNDRREALQEAVSAHFGVLAGEGGYIEDFGSDWVIWTTWQGGDSRYWRCEYETNEEGITLGQPVEVTRETTFVPVSDGAPGAGTQSGSQAVAIGEAGEGTGAELSDGPAAKEGADKHMNAKALTILKLAEDAGDDATSAAVIALAEERDTAVKALADREKAEKAREFEAKLAEALAEKDGAVKMLPGERDTYLALAEIDHEKAMAAVQARIDGPAALKLGAAGSDHEGDADEAKPADVELAETAKARAAKDGISYARAEKLVLSEDAELAERYREFRMNPRKEA